MEPPRGLDSEMPAAGGAEARPRPAPGDKRPGRKLLQAKRTSLIRGVCLLSFGLLFFGLTAKEAEAGQRADGAPNELVSHLGRPLPVWARKKGARAKLVACLGLERLNLNDSSGGGFIWHKSRDGRKSRAVSPVSLADLRSDSSFALDSCFKFLSLPLPLSPQTKLNCSRGAICAPASEALEAQLFPLAPPPRKPRDGAASSRGLADEA